MTTPWHKVIRDFWKERTRTVLVVLSISLGIAGFGAVLSAYAILTRELDKGYLATNPASAILRSDRIDDSLIAAILENHEVSDAEPRRVVTGQIKTGPMRWRNLTLFVVKDYGNIRVSKLEHEQGSWPPATGQMLIERDALQVADARIGQTVTVKTANGVEEPLIVSGSVHDVGQAQARMENVVYGYITLNTLAQLGEEPYLNQLNILIAENRLDENHIRDVANDVKSLLESKGHQVTRVEIPRPGRHPHSDLMGLLLLIMSIFGLFVLVLSGIIVINLLTALMAAQVRQIGMMKAVGATRWQVARIYLGQALLLGMAAAVIGIPLGNIGGRILCRYMAVFLNFDITSFSVPAWVYVLVAIVGLVAPVLAASWPVWRGSGVSVKEALNDFGVSQRDFGGNWLDRLIARAGGTFRPFALSLRNSVRRKSRFALTLLTLTAGGIFFMTALNIRASIINTLDTMFAARKYDLNVVFGNEYSSEKLQRAVSKTAGVTKAEGWFTTEATILNDTSTTSSASPNSQGNAGSLHNGGSDGNRFTVVAVPAQTELLQMSIIAGRNLLPNDSDAIVINNALASRLPQLKVGERISLRMGPRETRWLVVGIAREAFSPPVAYIPLGFASQSHPDMVNSLRLALDQKDEGSIDKVKASLDQNLEQEGLRARGSSSTADSRFAFDQHMLMIYVFLIVMSAIIGGVGGLGLTTTMSLNVLERRREMGVLRAIGATPKMIWLLVVSEGLSVGILSWLLATLAAWPISKAVGVILASALFNGGLDFRFEWEGALVWFAVSILVGGIASFLPAWRASQTTVHEALAYQ